VQDKFTAKKGMENRLLKIISLIFLFSPISLLAQESIPKVNFDFQTKIIGDISSFYEEGLYPSQEQNYFSIAIEPELIIDWGEGRNQIFIDLFGRINTYDQEKTHWDIREFYYQHLGEQWDFNLGFKKIFWGVSELNHLVDIINQTDFIESFDGEQKLGQLMTQFTLYGNWGSLDLFMMSMHRKRTFPGYRGRFTTSLIINNELAKYESDTKANHIDVAARYSHVINIADFAISHFYGTSREPLISFDVNHPESLIPYYELIHQTGLEFQLTAGSYLVKFEGIRRESNLNTFYAFDIGLEYTFSNINGKGLDIGLLAEYMYDGRNEETPTGFDNDLFAGSRIAFNDPNDTQILIGLVIDLEQTSKLISLEASKRIFSNYVIEIESRILVDISNNDFLYPFRKDSFIKLTIARYF